MEVNCSKTFRSVKGKTVTIEAVIDGDKVREVKITGDFFVTDDPAFEEFEATLRDKSCDDIKSLSLPNIMLGASEEEIIQALLQCLPCSGLGTQ